TSERNSLFLSCASWPCALAPSRSVPSWATTRLVQTWLYRAVPPPPTSLEQTGRPFDVRMPNLSSCHRWSLGLRRRAAATYREGLLSSCTSPGQESDSGFAVGAIGIRPVGPMAQPGEFGIF